MRKDNFTTGEVARMLGFAQKTVITCIDKGLLVAYKLPMSKHRRITLEALLAFIEKHGLPMPKDLLPPGNVS